VQYLASSVWETGIEHNIIDENILEYAIDKIINNQQDYFAALYEMLTSYQQKVLLAIAVEPENIFSQEYSKKYHLSALSSTQSAVEKLIQHNIIEKQSGRYHFPDPFLKLWLQKLIN